MSLKVRIMFSLASLFLVGFGASLVGTKVRAGNPFMNSTSWSQVQTNTFLNSSWSEVKTTPKTRLQCTDNTCAISHGCANCAYLGVELPAGAQLQAIHCLTNAHYPDDYPHYELHEVAECTQDNSWSVFDQPTVKTYANGVVDIATTFHNRSHERDRDVQITVDWK